MFWFKLGQGAMSDLAFSAQNDVYDISCKMSIVTPLKKEVRPFVLTECSTCLCSRHSILKRKRKGKKSIRAQ